MKIKFNKSGTHVYNGRLKIRVDLYPDSGFKTYEEQHIDVFARELTEEESEKIVKDGRVYYTEEAKELQKLVPIKKQLNPFLCHFIKIDPKMKKSELKVLVNTIFDILTIYKLDDIISGTFSLEEKNKKIARILKDKVGTKEKFLIPEGYKEKIDKEFKDMVVEK